MGHKFPFSLERHNLPNDSEQLKDLIVMAQETMSYLQAELVLLKRFRYGSSSERKKKV
tara:strand:- start:110 stop:283 length:174 start_codon:yes stop_codon:yes gene_type:complete